MTTIEDTKTEAAVVAELQRQADGEMHIPLKAGEVYLVPKSVTSSMDTIDTDDYADCPRRKTGARSVTDAASFVAYVNRHADAHTEVYAHTNTSKVVGIIDSHDESGSDGGWQKHRVTLDLEHSKPWLAWTKADGTLFEQADFADFIDDRWNDVIDPEPARMVDIARTFQANTKVSFESALREASGDVNLQFVEDTTAKAGQKGNIEIPARIQLALRPYVGGPIYSIWASFRYRLRSGQVFLGFKLERPENILEAAFADIVTEIRDGRTNKRDDVETRVHDGIGDVPIFMGRPSV